MVMLPLTEFAYDGLKLYNRCHDAHSWSGHDAAEIREVFSTSGGSIAEELFAGFNDEHEGNERSNGILLLKDLTTSNLWSH